MQLFIRAKCVSTWSWIWRFKTVKSENARKRVKNAQKCYQILTKVVFLNGVCLSQMIWTEIILRGFTNYKDA